MIRRTILPALILLGAALCGCYSPRMTNRAIIASIKECEKAGLIAEPLRNFDGLIVGIQCAPAKSPIISQQSSGSGSSNVVGGDNVVINGEKVRP